MKNKYFNIVVEKILKYKGKIIEVQIVKKILYNILDSNYSDNKLYKLIHFLICKEYISQLKNGVYFVNYLEKFNIDNYLEENYWKLILKSCNSIIGKKRLIGGTKSLELNMSNFVVPEKLNIINDLKTASESLTKGKKIKFIKYTDDSKEFKKTIFKNINKIKIGNILLNVANLELSMLESLLNIEIENKSYIIEINKKILRKNFKSLDFENFAKILKHGKYNSSVNRLYKISKSIDDKISTKFLEIIKRYGYLVSV